MNTLKKENDSGSNITLGREKAFQRRADARGLCGRSQASGHVSDAGKNDQSVTTSTETQPIITPPTSYLFADDATCKQMEDWKNSKGSLFQIFRRQFIRRLNFAKL